jgi:hypothetical protein
MGLPTSIEGMGNILRLSNLKNAKGRRIVEEEPDFMQGMEAPDIQPEGTAQPLPNFSAFAQPGNLPEGDLGGELTSQSYDVRANSAMPQEDQGVEQPGIFIRMGRALKQYMTPERIPQEAASTTHFKPERIPQETPEGQYTPVLSNYMANAKEAGNKRFQTLYDLPPEPVPPEQQSLLDQEMNDEVQKALQNPVGMAVYGASNRVENDPALSAEFKTITGNELTPELTAQLNETEEAMQGVEDVFNGMQTKLGDRAEGMRQRILDNQFTDQDKYYIGLALLMPLIIGGIFGKEAGIGALAGGAKGVADVLGKRQENIREDEDALLDIEKQMAENQGKIAEVGLKRASLRPSLEEKSPTNHLKGMREKTFPNPETGEEQQVVEIAPDLWMESQFVSGPEGVTNARKYAHELAPIKTYTKTVDDLTGKLINAFSQLNDDNFFSKGFSSAVASKDKNALNKFSQDITVDGRKVKAAPYINALIADVTNAYGQSQGLGQMDKAAQDFVKNIVQNPEQSFIDKKSAIEQMLSLRDLTQNSFVNRASSLGFYPAPLIQQFENNNNRLSSMLNKKEENKTTEDVIKEFL